MAAGPNQPYADMLRRIQKGLLSRAPTWYTLLTPLGTAEDTAFENYDATPRTMDHAPSDIDFWKTRDADESFSGLRLFGTSAAYARSLLLDPIIHGLQWYKALFGKMGSKQSISYDLLYFVEINVTSLAHLTAEIPKTVRSLSSDLEALLSAVESEAQALDPWHANAALSCMLLCPMLYAQSKSETASNAGAIEWQMWQYHMRRYPRLVSDDKARAAARYTVNTDLGPTFKRLQELMQTRADSFTVRSIMQNLSQFRARLENGSIKEGELDNIPGVDLKLAFKVPPTVAICMQAQTYQQRVQIYKSSRADFAQAGL